MTASRKDDVHSAIIQDNQNFIEGQQQSQMVWITDFINILAANQARAGSKIDYNS